MGGAELINFIKENIGTLITPAVSIAGTLMAAIHLRKKTSIETSTQEFEKIKAGHLKEAADELLKSGKMTYTEYYKMNNFLDIAKKADGLWKERQTEEVKTESERYDFDWFMRFYDAVGTVSDEEMQELWAKILAGEILQQGSYSLRTLETLRNLSKQEAVLFRKICSYSINSSNRLLYLPNYEEYLEFAHITFGEVLKLSEYGLILCNSFLYTKIEVEAEIKMVCNNNELVMFVQSKQEDEKRILEISQFPLTDTGKELSMVIGASASNESVLQFGKLLKDKKGDEFNFSVNRILSIRENGIEYDDINLLEGTENIQ
ncbi:MAG: DUF2806 domain-containing protein [Lachnospiraceae bacterium]|nr:DUF2806 domain-containing protein [Lachnospiraceae bacterium]